MSERMEFRKKLVRILRKKGKSIQGMEREAGVSRHTLWRGVRTRSTLCAIAYYAEDRVEDLVEGTEMEDIWYG